MEKEATESGAVLCGEERSGGRGEDDDLEKISSKITGKNIDKTVKKNKPTGSTINDKTTKDFNDKTNKDFNKNFRKNFVKIVDNAGG